MKFSARKAYLDTQRELEMTLWALEHWGQILLQLHRGWKSIRKLWAIQWLAWFEVEQKGGVKVQKFWKSRAVRGSWSWSFIKWLICLWVLLIVLINWGLNCQEMKGFPIQFSKDFHYFASLFIWYFRGCKTIFWPLEGMQGEQNPMINYPFSMT